jgi:radical SAM protein with 4Fe4S-binding SPASM domain
MARLVERSLRHNLPLNVHFDLTYRCNERCVHCYLEHDDHGELSTGEVLRILAELADAGTLFLTFSGGEIFLRRDLFDLLARARELRFDLALKTNALLVNAERAVRLKALGVRKVQVSLYSADPAVHDAITRVPGSFARTLDAIRMLKARGILVKLSCPLMKQNLAAFRGVERLAAELDVPYILDHTITPMINGARSVTAFRVAAGDLLPVLSDPVLNPRARSAQEPEENERRGGGEPASETARAYDSLPCSAGHNSCYISPYGEVFPCVQMPVAAGSLRRESFRSVWFGSRELGRVRAVRESMLPVCSACSIRRFCQRCPGLAQMEDGDPLGPSERACQLAEMNARVAGIAAPLSEMHRLQMEGKFPLRGQPPSGSLVAIAQAVS